MSLPTSSPSCAPSPGRKHEKKNTVLRRRTCIKYDKPVEMKQQHTTGTRPNGPVRVKDGGHGFKTHMAALIGLRGLKRKDNFQLFSKKDDAGNFYDLVYTAGGRRYFLQLKHADFRDKQKLTEGELVALLQKCFKSYCDVKHGKDFRDIPVHKTEFIIYTARKPDPELAQFKRTQTSFDIYFKKRDQKVSAFKFISDENKDFHLSGDREMVSEFFKRMVMVISQGGKCQLDDEIRMEIEDAMKFGREMCTEEIFYFKTQVETMSKNRKQVMTAEMFKNCLQKATEACELLSSLSVSFKQTFLSTGIHFAGSEISRLQTELSDKPAVHLRSDAPALCSILLLDCLPVSKSIFVNLKSLQSDRSKLLHAWLGGDWQWFVVFCDSETRGIPISDVCPSMFSMDSNKCLIILTSFSVKKIQGFSPVNHKFKFQHLSKKSLKMVLDKQIEFQGHKLPVGIMLHRHGIVEDALGDLGAGMVKGLVTKGTVKLGSKRRTNSGYYEPRVLKKEVLLRLDVLRNPDSNPNTFAVSGMEVKQQVCRKQQVLQRDRCPQMDRTRCVTRQNRNAVLQKSLPTFSLSGNPCPGRKSKKKYSVWLREIFTGYDEPLEVKQQHTTDTRPKGPWRVKGGGHKFETQKAALIGRRGLKRKKNIKIFFNRDRAGTWNKRNVYTGCDEN